MKIKLHITILLMMVVHHVFSLSNDSEQNIEIEADKAEMDDANLSLIHI